MFVQTDITAEDFKENRCLLERWESLSTRVEEAQRASAIHRDIAAMHLEFRAAHDRIMAYEVVLEKPHILDERINRITICMNCAKVVDIKDKKRHSRNCSIKQSPGQYEEPDVTSSSDEEEKRGDENIRIINAVRVRQSLWDNRMTKNERNPTINAKLWDEVDKELGLERGRSKLLWSTLRHRFSSERRKVEAGVETVWQYYNPLLFLIATRQPKQSSPVLTPSNSSTPQIVVPKMFEPKKKKGPFSHQQVIEESTQLVPTSSRRSTAVNKDPLYVPSAYSDNERRKRDISVTSDSDVDVVEEINLTNGSLMQRHIENPISYKRVCIRRMQETQLQNIDDDDEDDEIKRFCSYLEVMLRKMPKMHQELFCEETLDHLASVNRKLRRSNY